MNTGDAEWLIDVVYQSLCIFAVPVFFMISGANLLGYRKKYDTKTFFVKRFKKVVFTLCVASAIVYVSSPLIKYAVAGYPVDSNSLGFRSETLYRICNLPFACMVWNQDNDLDSHMRQLYL